MIRILAVCTGNVCRSPVVERLLERRLSAAGHDVEVRSAGTRGANARVNADTVRAARGIGVELSGHVSRRLTADLIARDGSDLVVTMTREHLRTVVAIDPDAWPRTFTLKELARRTATMPDRPPDFRSWRDALGADRRPVDLLTPSPDDDLPDPFGLPYEMHLEMVAEVDHLVAAVVDRFPR